MPKPRPHSHPPLPPSLPRLSPSVPPLLPRRPGLVALSPLYPSCQTLYILIPPSLPPLPSIPQSLPLFLAGLVSLRYRPSTPPANPDPTSGGAPSNESAFFILLAERARELGLRSFSTEVRLSFPPSLPSLLLSYVCVPSSFFSPSLPPSLLLSDESAFLILWAERARDLGLRSFSTEVRRSLLPSLPPSLPPLVVFVLVFIDSSYNIISLLPPSLPPSPRTWPTSLFPLTR